MSIMQVAMKGGGPYNSSHAWPLFDGTVWDAFWDNNDHIVPQLELVSPNKIINTPQEPKGGSPSSLLLLQQEASNTEDALLENIWNGFDNHATNALPVISESARFEVEEASKSTLYEDGSIYRGSEKSAESFYPNDAHSSRENFNLFGANQENSESESLLEMGWDSSNLEDMGKLFQSGSPAYAQSSNDFSDEVLWPSFSSGSGNNGPPLSGSQKDEIDAKAISRTDYDSKIELIPLKPKSESIVGNVEKDAPFHSKHAAIEQDSIPQDRQNNMSRRRQRCFEESLTEPRKKLVPRPLEFLQPESLQFQQSSLLLVGHSDSPKLEQIVRRELSSQLPLVEGAPMTPQQKLEKLRWRQKMQVKLVDEYQKKLISPMSSNESLINLVQPCGPVDLNMVETNIDGAPTLHSGSAVNQNEESVEATVLQQLQASISNLDGRTRLCIGDALYRLAHSAIERRTIRESGRAKFYGHKLQRMEAAGVGNQNEEMSTLERYPDFHCAETETNAIDRSIAQLLFPKVSVACNQGNHT